MQADGINRLNFLNINPVVLQKETRSISKMFNPVVAFSYRSHDSFGNGFRFLVFLHLLLFNGPQ